MPLYLLLVLVVAGIAGIALMLHLTGRSRPKTLSDEIARAEWARHFPDEPVVDLTITEDRHAAIVRTRAGAGLLWSFGDDTVARPLLDFDFIETKDGIRVDFHDFTAPGITIHLDPFERRHWLNLMDPT